MSGIEVAGLVLGAYPVLLSTAKSLREVFKDVKTWWRFEREFENFLSTVETEHIKYSLNLQILLDDLDVPEEEKESLRVDSTASGWHDAQIRLKLRHRIQDCYYDWFMRQLAAMNKALSSLQSLLPIAKAHYMDFRSLEREMFRLKASFTHQKDVLLAEVRDRNNEIFEFLQRASYLSGTRKDTLPRPSRKHTALLLALQEDASALYETFQTHLRCKCTGHHSCGIAVSSTNGSKGQVEANNLKLLFWDGPCRTQVIIQSISTTDMAPTELQKPASDKLEEVSSLHQRVSVRNRVEAVRKTAPKALFALASSSIPTFGKFSLGDSRRDSADSEDQPKRTRRIRWSSSISKEDEAESVCEDSPPRVRFADDPLSDSTGHTGADKGTTAINDLCQAIQSSMRPAAVDADNSGLGFLESRARSKFLLNLDPKNQIPLQGLPIESLEAFVKATPRRDDRLKVGCELARAILGLGTSPWIPATWTAKDLFLVRDPEVHLPTPFFSHTSLRVTLSKKEPKSTVKQTQDSLFALGVLLLELIFRDQLENQPCRAALMGPDKKPTATTNLATALEWQKRVEEELGHELADAVKRCLVCMFEQAVTPDLGNSGFVQAVWQQVIRPIESFISAWNRS